MVAVRRGSEGGTCGMTARSRRSSPLLSTDAAARILHFKKTKKTKKTRAPWRDLFLKGRGLSLRIQLPFRRIIDARPLVCLRCSSQHGSLRYTGGKPAISTAHRGGLCENKKCDCSRKWRERHFLFYAFDFFLRTQCRCMWRWITSCVWRTWRAAVERGAPTVEMCGLEHFF